MIKKSDRKRGVSIVKPSKEDVIAAVYECGGVVKDVMRKMKLSITTFYRDYRRDPDIDHALREAHDMSFDGVVDTLYSRAIDGDTRAAGLILKFSPSAKQAGWCEEQKVTLKSEAPLTEDEKEQLKQDLFGNS